MQRFCSENDVRFLTPNVDYRDFQGLIEDQLFEWNQCQDQGYEVVFMGSSMGGFASEYLAVKTGGKAIMINPVISPSALLPQFIGVTENFETGQPYTWHESHCGQYLPFEQALRECQAKIDRTILLDMGDELLDSKQTILTYQAKANILTFAGGSHSFDHMQQALSVVEQVLFPELKQSSA